MAWQQSTVSNEKIKGFRNVLTGLGIAESVLGLIVLSLGITAVVTERPHKEIPETVAEGIWCGFLITAAGMFGIITGSRCYSRCWTIAHLIFNIIATFTAAVLFGFSVVLYYFHRKELLLAEIIFSVIAFVLHIVSSSYARCIGGACCQPFLKTHLETYD